MSAPDDRTLLVPPAAAGGPARIRRATLRFAGGPEDGREVPIPGDAFTIGSAPGCDLRLADGAVSRRHCRVYVDPALGYAVEDLGSTNGTFVNGVRVSRACLPPDAELRLGGTALVFSPQKGARALERSAAESFGRVVGRSDAMRRVFHLAETYAPTEATVMIAGETGTGKEVMAREIHAHSPRRGGPFLVIDCAALSRELVESELFGHVKGAFTGAAADRVGAFEAAQGGTVFLDEIGDLPADLQPKLLRVLENREVRRVGSNDVRKVDVRILCATNKRLDEEVNAGRFREDLFYRLSVVVIEMPPLRERPEDVPLLARAFARDLHGEDAPDALAGLDAPALLRHPWPGNVRELRNLVDRAFYAPARPVDLAAALAAGRLGARAAEEGPALGAVDASQPFKEEKARLVDAFERRYLAALLERNGGNVSRSAREAGIERAYLQRLVKKFGLRADARDPAT